MGFFVACLVRAHDNHNPAPVAPLQAARAEEEEGAKDEEVEEEEVVDDREEVADDSERHQESTKRTDVAADRGAPGDCAHASTAQREGGAVNRGASVLGEKGLGRRPSRLSLKRAKRSERGLRGGLLLKRHFARGFGRSAFY